MKKSLSAAILLAATAFGYAQVGINTTTPASTLDITAKNSTGTSKNVDGLLIPRVDRERAQSMASVPTSTLVYVNDVSRGTLAGTTINVDTVGYYYFDGKVWVKLNSGSGSGPNPSVNIYNSDGTLTGNRTVTQADKTLTFTATAKNAFSVDGKTFSVDAANDRVGIGTDAPENKFHVVTTSATSNRFSTIDAPAGVTQTVALALRNTSPLATGNYALLGFTNSGAAGGGAAWGIGSIRTGSTSASGSQEEFYIGNSTGGAYMERMRINTAGNVGIGTSAPTNPLHIKAAADPLKLEGVKDGDSAKDQLLGINSAGVVKSLGTTDDFGIPRPTVFRLDNDINNFLQSQVDGGAQMVPMTLIKNSIPGLTYSPNSGVVTFPAGTYQMMLVYEGVHNATGCTISSYFVDFPAGSGTTRIHSTASHLQGTVSNHGGSITYVTTVSDNARFQIHIGRGVSGNCHGAGMLLRGLSTQLLIYRIGN